MRLLALTVRNYRVHREVSLTFDPARNLIGGPNESGKSTLAEAAHRALFLRAKTGGSLHKEMVSARHLGDPEVVLTFEAVGTRWELEKRFAGARGSTRLTPVGGTTLKDDDAETRLAELLRIEPAGRPNANQLAALWSHLWVWQGDSGTDPSRQASEHKDTLIQRLQQDGIAAVMQSAADQQVRTQIAAEYAKLFTPLGKPRAGSPSELARAELETAEAALQAARDTANRLEQAAEDHAQADKEIAETDAVLPSLRAQLTAVEAKLAQVRDLRAQEESRLRAWEAAGSTAAQIAKADAQLREYHQQSDTTRAALLPATNRDTALAADEADVRQANQAAALAQRETADAARQARLGHELAVSSVTAFEKAESHQRLAARAQDADAIRAELAVHREALAKLPVLTAKELTQLRQLDRAASQASATLEAMATGIEVVRADLPVTLDGQPLAPGDTSILTDTGELALGAGTLLRIRPGGGASLAEARAREETARRALATALDRHTLRDLDHAAAVAEQRQTLEQQLAHGDTRWKALGGDTLTADLAAAATALDAARAEVERRQEALGTATNLPATLADARSFQTATQAELAAAERSETAARRSAEQLRVRFEQATQALQTHRENLSASRLALRDVETRIKALEEHHGDTAARAQALLAARAAEQHAAAELAATRQALSDLAPAALADDRERFQRAIAQQETRRREAENRRLVARDRLTLDGSSDPQADLSHARARCETARETHATEHRRAQAIAQLQQLFADSREAIDRNLVQPLAERISGYLQCLFGSGARVVVKLSDSGIEGLELVRADDPTFGFATLSGGAREQVAAAVRLAMAEILAADHDGCLPLVFDDAFAYTDPDRVQALQRMLDHAAVRGLQIIVLTCAPTDYSAFGARELRLA